jgi:hypothetical protein
MHDIIIKYLTKFARTCYDELSKWEISVVLQGMSKFDIRLPSVRRTDPPTGGEVRAKAVLSLVVTTPSFVA